MDSSFIKETVRFYFSFNDPYSFFVAAAVKNLSQNYKIEIDYIPLSGFDGAGLFSDDEAVRAYWRQDAERFSKKAGRAIHYAGVRQDSMKVCRGYFLAQEKMLGLKYINLVLAMRWLNAKDIGKTNDIVESLKFLEFDEAELIEALESDKYAPPLAEMEAMAKKDGVIGVPFYVFRGASYWGADRLEYLEETLRIDPSLIIHHDASYSVIKAGELAKLMEEGKPLFVLDVRIPKEYGQAHIPGANCIPAKVVHRHMDQMDRDWVIVVVDDGGIAAAETAFRMASEGFRRVSVLSGGFPAWKGSTGAGLDNWRDKLLHR